MLGTRHPLLAAAAALSALSACCSSKGQITTQNFDCTTLADWCTAGADAGASGACKDHTYCDPIHKQGDPDYQNTAAVSAQCHKCYFEQRKCQTSADCCPGETCNPSLNLCFDCYNLDSSGSCGSSDCTGDAECVNSLGPGHVCVLFNSPDGGGPQIQGESAPSWRCTYPTCQSEADCAAGSSCFPTGSTPYGYCLFQPPCNGSCAQGTACTVTDDLCSPVPADKPNCQQTCAPGAMLVFKDETVPTGVYDACNLPAVDCTCAVLPPLHSDDIGRYSSLAAKSGQIWVSAYDGQFGDLVAFHFAADGGLLDLEYVDGVPDGGTIVADPTGPRGGISTPGPNVGEWTSVALGSDGQPRISYYDVDHRALKYAQRSASGHWTIEWVDGWDGVGEDGGGADVGSYTSLALNGSDSPTIAYFQAGGPTATTPLQTAVKLATAGKSAPQGPGDWILSTVDSADKPAPPCFPATCTSTETCVGAPPAVDGGPVALPDGGCEPYAPPDNGGACLTTSTRCPTGDAFCGNGHACVTPNGGSANCEVTSTLCSPACTSSERCIAADGGASCQPDSSSCGGCGSTQACVENDAGVASCQPTFAAANFNDLPEGVGLFNSLAFGPGGSPAVAYYDRLHGDLRLAVASGGGFTVTTIDGTDPATCADTGDVGYFPSLRVNGSNLAVAYQDGTDEELLFWTGATPAAITPGERVVVDNGTIQAPAPNGAEDVPMFAGANVSLRFGASGKAYFAYQNQTQISLRLAAEPAGCGTQNPSACSTTIVDEWAAAPEGFYSQVAIDGSTGWLSSAQIKALTGGVDNQLLLEGPVSLP